MQNEAPIDRSGGSVTLQERTGSHVIVPTHAPLASAGKSDSSGTNKNAGGAQVITRAGMETRAGRASKNGNNENGRGG